ncbi:5100_t:CDS:2 [Paraglomus brasilianum]|uniref:5100_t:CDS:1 n=1 Tax=Paraglomus brasilianum TaxID=144538 RepID=A0A9N8VP17_9GLOM|nr:5100_t:CDS:2 [Paraglomus brasilianum]
MSNTNLEDVLSSYEDLYCILNLSRTASSEEIKKSYRKLALEHHPDKHVNSSPDVRADATKKFQSIVFAYSILSDEKKRNRYDKTGETDGLDSLDGLDEKGWTEYFKELWSGTVNAKTIEEFKNTYQGSEEERKDLTESYTKHKGDMNLILSDIPCSSTSDEPRFISILQEEISSKTIPLHKKFTTTTTAAASKRRRKAAEKEAKEAEKMAEELGLDGKLLGNDDGEEKLKEIMRMRGKKRMNDLIESLEKKYDVKRKKGKSKKS